MGYLQPRPGRIRYNDRNVVGLAPHAVARLGLGFVPQDRGIFPSLTVRENLTVFARSNNVRAQTGDWNAHPHSRSFRFCVRAETISASSFPAANSKCCRSREP